MTTTLNGPEIAPAGAAKKLLVLLHGYGADGNDLIGLVPVVKHTLPEGLFYTSPHAPFPCEMAPYGRQWFGLRDYDPVRIFKEIKVAADHLNAYLDALLAKLSLTDADMALAGFSQGTMMALHVALRRPNPCAGVVGFSGKLIGPGLLKDDIKSRPPVLLVHGTADNVVPFSSMAEAEQGLKDNNVPVETLTCPGTMHSIDNAGLEAAVKFLNKVLG